MCSAQNRTTTELACCWRVHTVSQRCADHPRAQHNSRVNVAAQKLQNRRMEMKISPYVPEKKKTESAEELLQGRGLLTFFSIRLTCWCWSHTLQMVPTTRVQWERERKCWTWRYAYTALLVQRLRRSTSFYSLKVSDLSVISQWSLSDLSQVFLYDLKKINSMHEKKARKIGFGDGFAKSLKSISAKSISPPLPLTISDLAFIINIKTRSHLIKVL